MVAIPGWAYVAIGCFMSIYSYVVSRINPAHKPVMMFFLVIGILLVVVGLAKIMYKKEEKKLAPMIPQQRYPVYPQQQMMQQHYPQQPVQYNPAMHQQVHPQQPVHLRVPPQNNPPQHPYQRRS
jgi:hypothetical protein